MTATTGQPMADQRTNKAIAAERVARNKRQANYYAKRRNRGQEPNAVSNAVESPNAVSNGVANPHPAQPSPERSGGRAGRPDSAGAPSGARPSQTDPTGGNAVSPTRPTVQREVL